MKLGMGASSLATALVMAAGTAAAEPPSGSWFRHLDGGLKLSDAAERAAVGPDGSVSVTGVASAATGLEDMLTARYSAAGDLIWSHRYNGPLNLAEGPQDIVVDAAGNTFVVGQVYRGNRATGGTDWDYVTIKYAPGGEILWTAYYDGAYHGSDTPMAVVVAPDGGVYIGGFSMKEPNPTGGFATHFHVMKYDAGGVQQWELVFDETPHWGAGCNDLALDAEGNLYATGMIIRSAGTGGLGDDVITMKISPEGQTVWTRYWNTDDFVHGTDQGFQVRVDPRGNALVMGRTFNSEGNRNQDEVIIRYSPQGDESWVYVTDFDRPDGMIDATFDEEGNVYCVGGWSNELDNDGVLVSLSPEGVERWRHVFDGPANFDQQEGHFVRFGPDGRLYIGLDWQYADAAGYDVTVAVFDALGEPVDQWRYDAGTNSDTFQSIGGWAMDERGTIYAAGYSWFTASLGDYLVMRIPTADPAVCYADCDQSTGVGVLDFFDFICFQDFFAAGDPYADCDQSTGAGVFDFFDFICFQDAFASGCE